MAKFYPYSVKHSINNWKFYNEMTWKFLLHFNIRVYSRSSLIWVQFTPSPTVVVRSLPILFSSQEIILHRFITLTVLHVCVKFSILLLLLRIIEVSCINYSKRPAVSLCIYLFSYVSLPPTSLITLYHVTKFQEICTNPLPWRLLQLCNFQFSTFNVKSFEVETTLAPQNVGHEKMLSNKFSEQLFVNEISFTQYKHTTSALPSLYSYLLFRSIINMPTNSLQVNGCKYGDGVNSEIPNYGNWNLLSYSRNKTKKEVPKLNKYWFIVTASIWKMKLIVRPVTMGTRMRYRQLATQSVTFVKRNLLDSTGFEMCTKLGNSNTLT